MQSLAPYSGDKSLRLSQLSEDEQRGEGDKYDRLHRRIIWLWSLGKGKGKGSTQEGHSKVIYRL